MSYSCMASCKCSCIWHHKNVLQNGIIVLEWRNVVLQYDLNHNKKTHFKFQSSVCIIMSTYVRRSINFDVYAPEYLHSLPIQFDVVPSTSDKYSLIKKERMRIRVRSRRRHHVANCAGDTEKVIGSERGGALVHNGQYLVHILLLYPLTPKATRSGTGTLPCPQLF